uniref:Uncharacterized protein n=1 Tax=Pantoea phage Survivor TaxID=3232176 RepID=A0AAU8L0H6_9CAUD
MEQTLQDINHYARIISGCESINYVSNNGGQLTDDGRYAQSVLRLHAQDEFGALAGNESILSGIKKGAKKLKEWIVALIKAVKDFITGSQKKKKDFEAEYNKLKAAHAKVPAEKKDEVEEKLKKAVTPYGQVFDRIIEKLKKLRTDGQGEAFEKIGYKADLNQTVKWMETARDHAEEGLLFMAGSDLKMAGNNLDGVINIITGKLNTYSNGEDTPEKNAAASRVAGWLNVATSVGHSITMNMSSMSNKASKELDAWMNA